ncbi:MAG: TrbI/VirB10 family protein [Elusimicrobiota bacterium]
MSKMIRNLFFCCICVIILHSPVLCAEPPAGTGKFLHTGFNFDCVLITAIFSFNTISPVIAKTEYDISFNGKTVLPRNTKIIGTAQVVKTIDRVNVRFETIVFPDGSEISFSGVALWPDGSGGIRGKVRKHKAKLPAKILLRTASAGVGYATRSALAEDITESITKDAEQEMAEKVDYSISIDKGTPILVFIDKRLEF